MNKAMVIVATLLFCVNAYAGEGNLKKLLAEVDKTTDTITIDGYGYAISASTPLNGGGYRPACKSHEQ